MFFLQAIGLLLFLMITTETLNLERRNNRVKHELDNTESGVLVNTGLHFVGSSLVILWTLYFINDNTTLYLTVTSYLISLFYLCLYIYQSVVKRRLKQRILSEKHKNCQEFIKGVTNYVSDNNFTGSYSIHSNSKSMDE